MEAEPSYVSFPICALFQRNRALKEVTHEEKQAALAAILHHTIFKVGHKMYMETEQAVAYNVAEREARSQGCEWFDGDSGLDTLTMLGAKALGVRTDRPAEPIEPREFGALQVRLSMELFEEYAGSRLKTWREFAVLCSIYAAIGRNRYQKISFERIRTMAMGFSGQAEWKQYRGMARPSTDHRLTVRQTQITTHHLHERGLFAMVCPNGRHNYYSHRMTARELADALVEQEAKRQAKKLVSRDLNASLQERISQRAKELANHAIRTNAKAR